MPRASRIMEKMHARILEVTEPGMRKIDLVIEIYHSNISGVSSSFGDQGFGEGYPALVPKTPTGADASDPDLTWDAQPITNNSGNFFEITGFYQRYHCPLSRTVYLGKPPRKYLDVEKIALDSIESALNDVNLKILPKILNPHGAKPSANSVMKKQAVPVMPSA